MGAGDAMGDGGGRLWQAGQRLCPFLLPPSTPRPTSAALGAVDRRANCWSV